MKRVVLAFALLTSTTASAWQVPTTTAPPETPTTTTEAPPPPTTTSPEHTSSSQRALRLAVYEFKVSGVDDRVGHIVTDAVVAELRKLQRVSVVSMDEVRAMLDFEAQKQLAGCSEESCVAEIAEALGVDGVVTGDLAVVGGERVFGMRRIDQRAAKTLGQVNQRLQDAGGEEFLAAIGPAVQQLFPECPLREGMQRGVGKELGLRLNPPPLSPVVFWISAGTTTAVGVAAVATLAVNVTAFQANTTALSQATAEKPGDGGAITDQQALIDQTFTASVVLGGLVVAGAAATAVVAAFTDWNGFGDE